MTARRVTGRRVRLGVFVAVGLAVAVALAFLVAPHASSEPDGLERVALDEGFAEGASDHDLSGSPTADYGVRGIDDDRLGTGLAGVVGIGVTFLVAAGVTALVRRRRPSEGGRSGTGGASPGAPAPSAPPA